MSRHHCNKWNILGHFLCFVVIIFCVGSPVSGSANSEINSPQAALEHCLRSLDEAVLIKSEEQFQHILQQYKTGGMSINNNEGRYRASYVESEQRSFNILTEEKDGGFLVTFTSYQTVRTRMGDYGELARYKYRVSQDKGTTSVVNISRDEYIRGPTYMWQCMEGSESCFNKKDGEHLSQFKTDLYALLNSFE